MEYRRIPLDVRTLPTQGAHLIEASAGTGKTYTITSLVLKMIAERGLRIDQILAVTFTNAATAELRERISARLAAALLTVQYGVDTNNDPMLDQLLELKDREQVVVRLTQACRDVDCASVFTIHGFAARVLRDFPLESGARLEAELIGDNRSLIADVVTDFWLARVTTLPKDEFLAVGGAHLYDHLNQVARVAAGSFDVPRVPLDSSVLSLSAALVEFRAQYEHARLHFEKHAADLKTVLMNSAALSRVKMAHAAIEREFAACLRYFELNNPELLPPEFGRLTRSKVIDSLKKNQAPPDHLLLEIMDDLHVQARQVAQAAAAKRDALCAALCDEVQLRLAIEHSRLGTQSFDSLLSDLCLALRRPDTGAELARQLRSRLPIALVDEFQDTDSVQYEIFRRIYLTEKSADCALYLIGDPKQSIYAFRGADVFTYFKAWKAVGPDVLTLTTSYRASPALVEAQNLLFANCQRPFGLDQIVYDKISARPGRNNDLLEASGNAAPGMRLVYCGDREQDWLVIAAHEIAALLNSGMMLDGKPLKPSDIAVLTRTNRDASDIQQHLRRLGIVAVMHGDRSVFETQEALEIRSVLLALCQPKRKEALRAALATSLFGLSIEGIASLDTDVDLLELWVERFQSYSAMWRTRGFARCFEAIFSDLAVVRSTLSTLGGERRMTNLRHLLELLHDAEATQHLGLFGLIRFLEDAIFDRAAHGMASEARQLRLESDDQAVVLTTAHKSKGLEYNIVVLPVLARADRVWKSAAYRFHDTDTQNAMLEYRGAPQNATAQRIHDQEELQESLRLAYVALTRAKHQVIAFFDSSHSYSPLGYLLFSPLLGSQIEVYDYYLRRKELKNHDLLACAARLSQGNETAIWVGRPTAFDTATAKVAPRPIELRPPPPVPQVSEQEATSSFSAMTRSSHLTYKARQGRDQSDLDGLLDGSRIFSPGESGGRCLLADFPRGARPGEALHSAFELSPFDVENLDRRQQVIEQQLTRYGISAAQIDVAKGAIDDVLRTEFRAHNCESSICLQRISAQAQMSEMEFSLPVGAVNKRLTVERLYHVLKGGKFSVQYLTALKSLQFEAYTGFLRGFIDLVYVHEGKLYALDYKSNYLGDSYDDYNANALQGAMEQHHYLLQALLYTVALHQYGKLRIPSYDYDQHFGGMQYLFLRGMRPDLGENGVFSYRPQKDLILSLSAIFQVKHAEPFAIAESQAR